ncbi:hypothetical protein B0H19DRAFT_1083862 [Mycena capillaripes]|nr:hypothetical protein B0H19DRAFT_1083862 [Mycena capillaripes]
MCLEGFPARAATVVRVEEVCLHRHQLRAVGRGAVRGWGSARSQLVPQLGASTSAKAGLGPKCHHFVIRVALTTNLGQKIPLRLFTVGISTCASTCASISQVEVELGHELGLKLGSTTIHLDPHDRGTNYVSTPSYGRGGGHSRVWVTADLWVIPVKIETKSSKEEWLMGDYGLWQLWVKTALTVVLNCQLTV